MSLILGYIILVIAKIIAIPSIISSLIALPFTFISRMISIRQSVYIAYVPSFIIIYMLIDKLWKYIYDYNTPLLVFVIFILSDFLQLISSSDNMNENAIKISYSEIISVVLVGIYTLTFKEFNWV
jgi:hypothetical protein